MKLEDAIKILPKSERTLKRNNLRYKGLIFKEWKDSRLDSAYEFYHGNNKLGIVNYKDEKKEGTYKEAIYTDPFSHESIF